MRYFPSLPSWRMSSWLTIALIVLLVGIFFFSVENGELDSSGPWVDALGLTFGQLKAGKIWTLVSYSLLHGNYLHLVLNLLFLYYFLEKVATYLDWKKAFKILLTGCFVGGFFYLFLDKSLAEDRALVGISGGLMALFLLRVTLSPQSKMWPLPLSAANVGLGVMLASAMLALINPAMGVPLLSDIGEKVNTVAAGIFGYGHACHFGGGFAGFLIGKWILRRPISLEQLQKQRQKREG